MQASQAGGRCKDFASGMRLVQTVLIPFPLPSILEVIMGILYLKCGSFRSIEALIGSIASLGDMFSSVFLLLG